MTHTFAAELIDQLVQQGVELFCIAPGRRSTPLVVAAARHPKAKTFVHFDERGLAFHALGYGKATGKPAAVITTSGSALGNLMPAVMEADTSHVPLLLLTADRPPELQSAMANQTCDQLKLFGPYVRHFFDLPPPSNTLPPSFLATTLAASYRASLFPLKGPVHVNCPFRDPFDQENPIVPRGKPVHPSFGQVTLSEETAQRWARLLDTIEKGVIVIGAHERSDHAGIAALSNALGWPVFADVTSSYRSTPRRGEIAHYSYLLGPHAPKPEFILHFGDQLVSKKLMAWIAQSQRVVHIASHPKRCDPNHCVTDRVLCDPNLFAAHVALFVKQRSMRYAAQWQEQSDRVHQILASFLEEEEEMSEMGVVWNLAKTLPHEQALFIGSSMPIRDADHLLFRQTPMGPLFANRGLSGIDGNIATSAGIAQTQPVTTLIGDQTFLHDLNSLPQLTRTPHPVQLIVINNQGGHIFSYFTPPGKEELWKTYFNARHSITFEKAAELFSLPYLHITRKDEWAQVASLKGSALVEVSTCAEKNIALHHQISHEIEQALCSSMAF